MPSPTKPTTFPAFLSDVMILSFWLGSTSAKIFASTLSNHGLVGNVLEVFAAKNYWVAQAHLLTEAGHHQPAVSGNDLEFDAQSAKFLYRIGHSRFRGIKKYQEAQKRHVGFMVRHDSFLAAQFAIGYPSTRYPLLPKVSNCRWTTRRTSSLKGLIPSDDSIDVHVWITLGRAPFVIIRHLPLCRPAQLNVCG